jgi:hypothetical protein
MRGCSPGPATSSISATVLPGPWKNATRIVCVPPAKSNASEPNGDRVHAIVVGDQLAINV